jgi:excisionase family DNA binding protein
MTTGLSVARLFGNSSNRPGSSPLMVPRTGHTCGNAAPPLTPMSRPGRCCCCVRWRSGSDGKPSTPLRNWPPVTHTATVRQLMIKLRERGEVTVEKYLSVAETAEYLSTSERFVRRLIAERRIAFHHVGRHVRVALSDLDLWLASGRVEAIDLDDVRRRLGRVA